MKYIKATCSMAFRSAMIVLAAALPSARGTLVIDTVPVGNPGNAGDAQANGTFGSVGYNYRIGTYEITNSQYAVFLNSVAVIDTFGLYNPSMGSDARGGITQSGSSGSFTYSTRPNMGDKPVNFVSWFDAIRFTNWLHNNQPTGTQSNGTTESGAYTILSLTNLITRSPGATWFLPTENEWYKAAYHKNDGVTGNYFDYPTSSDSVPTPALANATGDISNPGANVANYNNSADWNGQDGNLTTVGSAGAASASPYHTFDQGGNVAEWNETMVFSGFRGNRAGWFSSPSIWLAASTQNQGNAFGEANGLGFRVATVATAVPEARPAFLFTLVAIIGLTAKILHYLSSRFLWRVMRRPKKCAAEY